MITRQTIKRLEKLLDKDTARTGISFVEPRTTEELIKLYALIGVDYIEYLKEKEGIKPTTK
jgi:hypothetical protein